jgi:hypothetical protein
MIALFVYRAIIFAKLSPSSKVENQPAFFGIY